ncbi:MAG TPA: ribulose-bisphosphate carboxylase large subunit family protein [Geminicoccaceae bacterium]|jgi:ribulose-bisphosphate carboxylase large chain|nr:ribulose-bisphosphate carboxylase large subunit family protein [Geminicoccaceae bacterium]
MTDKVQATYLIETPHSLEHAAMVIAGEQSSGTFVSVPGETDELKERFGAQVLQIKPLGSVRAPSLPGWKPPRPAGAESEFRRGEIVVSFPLHNFGTSLPNLLATVAGNLYELQELSGIRLIDLELPPAFAERYPGPGFGVDGTRKLVQIYERPLIGTIVKPSIGLSTSDLQSVVRDLAIAGLDFIKDDELHADPPYAPLAERVPAVMAEIERVADQTGKKTMYAFNISGDVDHMLRAHDLVIKHGGTCVMISVNNVGIAALAHLRKHCALPIHGHRNNFGAMSRHPFLGIGFTAYQKLFRLAGVDHLHVGGLDSKFYQTDEEVAQSITDCLTPLFGDYRVMPAISSAQWAGSAVKTYAETRTIDVIHLAGGGILGHPDGAAAGVSSMRQGWAAALAGTPLDEYAATHPELRAAIGKFGARRS